MAKNDINQISLGQLNIKGKKFVIKYYVSINKVSDFKHNEQ
jgi:hypothetical protein